MHGQTGSYQKGGARGDWIKDVIGLTKELDLRT